MADVVGLHRDRNHRGSFTGIVLRRGYVQGHAGV